MNKKISRFISAIVFLILFSAMSLNYAMAYEELPDLGYDFFYYDYGSEEKLVSNFQRKQTDNSIEAFCHDSTTEFRVKAVASNDYTQDEYDFIGNILPPSRSYDDVSNGYTYYLWKGRNADVYNWAYEWEYAYAGLEAIISSDNFWAKGAFNAS